MIVDHYGIWKEWEILLKDHVDKLMVIDDLADREHHCDLLLDQNLGSDISLYEKLISTSYNGFFGPEYALVRQEFYEWRDISLQHRKKGHLKTILINFGGGDTSRYIEKSLKILLKCNFTKEIKILIVLGGLATIDPEYQSIIDKFKARIEIYGMVENMAELLSKSDLVIGAAGSSSWERCSLGVPSIVFPIATNQEKIAKKLVESGVAITLTINDFENHNLSELINRLMQGDILKRMSQKAAGLAIGTGLKKIIHALKN